ncbi:unnamed protein product [Pleuronectes platessa]|uniref:Uncharacterized protein n=1 Tax=Pleuronectes platessa TaxID=8262 RepID=A0A9N7TU23_PLEPL|nr:unnamed protein product [Pleuronectes platessa]
MELDVTEAVEAAPPQGCSVFVSLHHRQFTIRSSSSCVHYDRRDTAARTRFLSNNVLTGIKPRTQQPPELLNTETQPPSARGAGRQIKHRQSAAGCYSSIRRTRLHYSWKVSHPAETDERDEAAAGCRVRLVHTNRNMWEHQARGGACRAAGAGPVEQQEAGHDVLLFTSPPHRVGPHHQKIWNLLVFPNGRLRLLRVQLLFFILRCLCSSGFTSRVRNLVHTNLKRYKMSVCGGVLPRSCSSEGGGDRAELTALSDGGRAERLFVETRLRSSRS